MLTPVEKFLASATAWAARQPAVKALALVGSHARGTARPDSDVDLLILGEDAAELVHHVEWTSRFGEVTRSTVEDWGRVKSIRVWYADGLEVEFGVTTPDWALEPDEGTWGVVRDGLRVLLDHDGVLRRLVRE